MASCWSCFVGIKVSQHRFLNAFRGDAYKELDSLAKALCSGNTVLIKGKWLLELYRKKRTWEQWFGSTFPALPRRQDLPEDAVWQPEELLPRLGLSSRAVKIVAVSHCWLGKTHPDANGNHLLSAIAPIVEQWLGYYGKEFSWDIAIFLDWCSLPQEPRTAQEERMFRHALEHVHLWYAHQCTDVWLLTKVPEGKCERRTPFSQRGWPTFERAAGHMNPHGSNMLDLGLMRPKTCTSWEATEMVCTVGRRPPLTPEAFFEELEDKVFSDLDDVSIVCRAYERTFADMMASVEALFLQDLQWPTAKIMHFTRALPLCRCLKSLYLGCNGISNRGAQLLADVLPQCSSLTALELDDNRIGEAGIVPLAAALAKCTFLDRLNLDNNLAGDVGASALGGTVAACHFLTHLLLNSNHIGPEGVVALARHMSASSSLEKISVCSNGICDDGAAELMSAASKCSRLRHVLLDGVGIGDAGGCALAEHMVKCKYLITLSLRHNDLADAAVAALEEAIGGCTHLQLLALSGNRITKEGEQRLTNAWCKDARKKPSGLRLSESTSVAAAWSRNRHIHESVMISDINVERY